MRITFPLLLEASLSVRFMTECRQLWRLFVNSLNQLVCPSIRLKLGLRFLRKAGSFHLLFSLFRAKFYICLTGGRSWAWNLITNLTGDRTCHNESKRLVWFLANVVEPLGELVVGIVSKMCPLALQNGCATTSLIWVSGLVAESQSGFSNCKRQSSTKVGSTNCFWCNVDYADNCTWNHIRTRTFESASWGCGSFRALQTALLTPVGSQQGQLWSRVTMV